MDLAQQIKQHYFDNFDELPLDKQFHFCTRLAAWQNDPLAISKLTHLKSYILPPEYQDNLAGLMEAVLNTPQTGSRNAQELRQVYFEKYPQLYGLHLALFRARHLKFVYGIDAGQNLQQSFGQDKFNNLINQLLDDQAAVRFLSTFAVNTFYLSNILYSTPTLEPEYFLDLAKGYDLSDKLHLQLLIYLFTHCIIGRSNFYTQAIAAPELAPYQQMLTKLETVIDQNFELINLDNKLEFLVCAQIANYSTGLADRIFTECEKSLSPQGLFLIDRHNQNKQLQRQTFAASEHRNVLYIMSTTPYRPHSTLIKTS